MTNDLSPAASGSGREMPVRGDTLDALDGRRLAGGGEVALAELETEHGTFLIQERRSRVRPDRAAKPETHANHIMSPQMMALGGLIIIGVLVGSYTTKYDVAIGHRHGALPVPQVGYLALQLFLARAALRSFEEVVSFESRLAFVVNRLLRYLPATVPGVLLGFLVVKAVGVTGATASALDLPFNLLMITDMVGGHDIDASHWRLKIEICQAALIGLAWFGPLRRHLPAVLTGGLLVCALTVAGEPGRHNALSLRGIVTGDGYLPLFAFGVALRHLAHDRSALVWRWVAGAALVLAGLSNTPPHGLVVAASLAILGLIAMGGLSALGRARWLVRLGEIAFPIYVVHFVTGFAVIERLEAAGVAPALAILAASALAVALGLVLNVAVERPIQTRAASVTAALRDIVGLVTSRSAFGRQAVGA